MSLRRIKVNGRKVWQARVMFKGLRTSAIRDTQDEARQVEADLLHRLKEKAGQAEQEGQRPATVKQLLDFYVADLEARGKGPDTVGRAEQTETAIAELLPDLLERPVSAVGDTDIFAFRRARELAGAKPSTVNRDMRTLRAALKKARPEYRFPGGAFFREDETRVRWLRPEEELLVLEPMPSPRWSPTSGPGCRTSAGCGS